MPPKLASQLLSGSILEEEIALEQSAVDAGIANYRRLVQQAVERGDGASLKPAERLLIHWMDPMVAAIREEQRAIRAGKSGGGRHIYGPILIALKAEALAVITIHETLGVLMRYPEGVACTKVYYEIGNSVIAECHSRLGKKTEKQLYKEFVASHPNARSREINWWAGKYLPEAVRGRRARIYTGIKLWWMLYGVSTIDGFDGDNFVQALVRERRVRGDKKIYWLTLSDEASACIEDGHLFRSTLRPRYQPMIVRPYPWKMNHNIPGGYIHIRTPFTSKPSPDQKVALASVDLTPTYECLNALTSTGFRINKRIYGLMSQAWESGGQAMLDRLGMPTRDVIALPATPEDIDTNKEAKLQWKKRAHDTYKLNIANRAERLIFMERLGVADRFLDREAFYYPRQLDFRSRCYPVPAHMNHQGPDVCRGLLEFADSVDLGENGLRHIAIEAANAFGQDKLSMDERVEWVNDHAHQIARAVKVGLDDDWWQGAKKPWQFLASCFALYDPESAQHVPTRRDGSCNGLQHYAAIGRDPLGASLVNLTPSDRPNDVYGKVTERVKGVVSADAAGARPSMTIGFSRREDNGSIRRVVMTYIELAQIALPYVCRDTCKPNVMTLVYDVTATGARDQLWEKLSEMGLPKKMRYPVCEYLRREVKTAVKDLCVGASTIMEWLRDSAKRIASSGHLVRWTNPLGFPVVQPYRQWAGEYITTKDFRVRVINEDIPCPVAVGKQESGCAPSFIHSIDAAHMLLTAKQCYSEGIPFADVHDQYWSHAGNRDRVDQITREIFVQMHEKEPATQRVYSEWCKIFPDVELEPPPEPGTFDVRTALDSVYLFG